MSGCGHRELVGDVVEALGVDVEALPGRQWVAHRPGDVGGAHAERSSATQVPGVCGHHKQALGCDPGDVDGELVYLGGRLIGLRGLG